MKDPDGEIVTTKVQKKEAVFSVNVTKVGDYKFIFSNKRVLVAARVGQPRSDDHVCDRRAQRDLRAHPPSGPGSAEREGAAPTQRVERYHVRDEVLPAEKREWLRAAAANAPEVALLHDLRDARDRGSQRLASVLY